MKRYSIDFRLGLRPRFLISMLALVILLLTGFVYAVSEFLDVLEDDMIYGELSRDMDRIAALYEYDPTLLQFTEPGLKVFVVPRNDVSSLPAVIADLPLGHSREVMLPGAEYEYGATRRDIGDKSLYVLLDLTPVERLEKELIGVAWVVGLCAMFLAVVLALWLSQVVMKPVRSLALRMADVIPGQQRPELDSRTGDRQLDVIVDAFDKVLDRFDLVVAREQAFTEDASHELRTPLAVLMSSIDLLDCDKTLQAKSRTRLMRARSAAIHMHQLIESLMLLAREQPGDLSCQQVSHVVDEAIAMQKEIFLSSARSCPEIVFNMHEDVTVHASASMVLSIVNNLLHNAIEHGRAAHIDITLDCGCLTIQDHGDGITPAALTRVFDRRFRGPHSQGQGIGLYLVKRISERFGWSVDVSSSSGQGTRFDLRFT